MTREATSSGHRLRQGPYRLWIARPGSTVCDVSLGVPRRSHRRLGRWFAAAAGLHPTTLEFLAERRVAVLDSDGNTDTVASAVDGVEFAVHILAITRWVCIPSRFCDTRTKPWPAVFVKVLAVHHDGFVHRDRDVKL
jgi:hypothetical protein